MTSVDSEPVPGTAFRELNETDCILREFLALVRRRFELDKKYAEDLRSLLDSVPPNWAESSIWSLISPFITSLDQETRLREQTTDALFARLEELPEYELPDAPDKDGVAASVKYEGLRPAYDKYQNCLSRVNTTESIALLQAWYQQTRVETKVPYRMTAEEIDMYVFPEVDRNYRASVIAQQKAVDLAVKWHEEVLPLVLRPVSRISNDAPRRSNYCSMTCLRAIAYCSQLSTRLAQHFSTLTYSVAAFSSSRFIAPLHDNRESETSHLLFKLTVYLNFYTDGSPGRPIFGLKVSDELQNELVLESRYNYVSLSYDTRLLSISQAFLIEKDPNATSISRLHPYWSDSTSRPKAIILSFFSVPPLISLPKDIFSLREDTRTRSKLKALMREVSNEAKDTMHRWILAKFDHGWDAGLLFHDWGALRLVLAIRRKWDFENDAPLPDGVIREFSHYSGPILIWKKTKEPYVPSKA